jgi:hypothetical protein
MTVNTTEFVAAMTQRWTTDFNNVSSPALEATWAQLASTFNAHIEAHASPAGQRWRVLKPATGSGKSQGLAVYCSMLPLENHPGVLVVTRLKTQADDIAQVINELAVARGINEPVAVAYHGDNRLPAVQLAFHPVVVVTHKAYEIGMDAVNAGQAQATNWQNFHRWGSTGASWSSSTKLWTSSRKPRSTWGTSG